MLLGKRIVVVLPAYNAAQTLTRTVSEIDRAIVDQIILVDDSSDDRTVKVAQALDLPVIRHATNRGYGANQKTCYAAALDAEADIVVMVHPDYQYTPKLIPAMASMLVHDVYDMVLASRILGGGALRGGMPVYKYVANRSLTLVENVVTGMKLSEYHTGYRAFSRHVLTHIPFEKNSDGFIFDNQILLQAGAAGFRVGEISCPTRYSQDSSSINLRNSLRYGLGCLYYAGRFWLHQRRLLACGLFRLPQ